ncbi:MAG: phenylalanine--tRNA ligase subunit beta [Desulfobacterales bacterium]
MKVSLSWLKDYVSIEMEIQNLADALTMAGLEVEAVSDRYDYLDSVVVGRVVKISPHPNADKLQVCEVDVGERIISVVCGAPNLTKDMLSPTALPGTVLPDGFILEKTIMRGVTSEGMLCSEGELGLGPDKSGIMTIRPSKSVGDKVAKALELSDMVVELDLTPNRPDCLSIIGIAREIAAIQKTNIRYPDISLSESSDNISDLTSVTIKAPDHCPRYAARLLFDVSIEPSPFWLQDRLMSVGLRPINNIVDLTNFVLMETGQPLHAFDFDNLAENRIVVRTANEGETFTSLDNKDRILSKDMLMICDGERPVAIGGVMGGLNSEIEESTTRILIESAYFDPVSIRKTSKKLGLKTDASHRFERGVDLDGTITALNRSAQLMAEIGGGKLIKGIIDEYSKPVRRKTITLSTKNTNRLLGTRLEQNEIKELLESIEFKVEKDDQKYNQDKLGVIPPSFRVDIKRPEDLMEEVARLSGYNNIPATFPVIPAEDRHPAKQLTLREKIKRLMIGSGFTEVINYSFVGKQSRDLLELASNDPRRRLLNILNPLTEAQAVMRTSIIPGLLGTMHRNISKQVKNLKLFEAGKIFISRGQDNLPEEIEMLAGLWTGSRFDISWHFQETDCDFYDIKGAVERLLYGLNINNPEFIVMPVDSCNYTKPGYTAQIISENNSLGLVGEVSPQVLNNFDLKQTAFIFELNLHNLSTIIPETIQSKPIPKFPAISRDITMVIDKGIELRKMLETAENIDEELVENIQFFDVFEGGPIPAGKKNISFRITYRSSKETLEDDLVNHIHKSISERLIKKFNADLP